MRIRWDTSYTNFSDTSLALRKKLELTHIKRQVEILATFLPDIILNLTRKERESVIPLCGVLLMVDICGYSLLCEKYNKTDGGGINRLTNTLNAYTGALIEAVYSFGGDVFHFTHTGFVAIWKVQSDVFMFEVIHHVIVCAVYIKENFGNFHTEVNIALKIKLSISCGNMKLAIIGSDNFKNFLLLGYPVYELKTEMHTDDMILIASSAWGHLEEECFEFIPDNDGRFVKLLKYYYPLNKKAKKLEYAKKIEKIANLCNKHIKHRTNLHQLRKFDDTLTDFKITEHFIQDLPPRMAVKYSAHNWMTSELKPFVIKPISYQVEEKLAVDYLTEMKQITLLFVNIHPNDYSDDGLLHCSNQSYKIICKYVSQNLGHVLSLHFVENYVRIVATFGLRGIKHELESRNALRAASKIVHNVESTMAVNNIAISVTIGLVYSGVIGHPHRREYNVVGEAMYKAWRLVKLYPSKVVCDQLTFKNSKLSAAYFHILPALGTHLGTIFEYNEEPVCDYVYGDQTYKNILGRDNIMDYLNLVVHFPNKIGNICGICFKGPHDIGVSKLISAALVKYTDEGHTVAAIELIGGKQRPYYTVSAIYNQIYNRYAETDSQSLTIIKDLPRDLWSFNEVLQKEAKLHPHLLTERKYKILNMFKAICIGASTNITIAFIDNVQYIDNKSFDVLQAAMEDNVMRVICGGCFEHANWDTLWKFSLSSEIKVMEVGPLHDKHIAPLLCQILNVKGISKKLVSVIVKSCNGKPGFVEKSILRLFNANCLSITYISQADAEKLPQLILPDDKLTDSEDSLTNSTKIPVVMFNEANTEIDMLSLDAITFEEYSIFTAYQQLVIKTSAVLGEYFSRILLIVALKYPHEQLFANTIKILFDENIFDCATKHLNCKGLDNKPLVCQCFDFGYEEQTFGLPKYAFCKLIFFKNKTLRKFAYNLLPPHHRKELHLKTTEILELQNNLCPNCIRDNSASIITMRKFANLAKACNLGVAVQTPSRKEDDTEEENLKKWVRKAMQIVNHREIDTKKTPKRKVYDSTTCFCVEILTKVYADLVYHSKCAGHLGKTIFFLVQYSILLITMSNYEDAIPLLSEASELCMFNSKIQYLTNDFRKIITGKTHILLAEAYLALGETTIAKNHIRIALRQYDTPMIAMDYTLPRNLLLRHCTDRNRNTLVANEKVLLFYKSDFSACMNLVSIIMQREGYYEVAKLAAIRSLSFARQFNKNVGLLCDVYSTAIELYSFCGDNHICERLEKNINKEILRCYSNNNTTFELYAICKLIFLIFKARTMNGELLKTIKIGYRAVEMNLIMQSNQILIDILPVLCSLLLMAKRIEDAVQLAMTLCSYSHKFDQKAFIGYFAFCLDLGVECSFYVEPLNKIKQFADIYFNKQGKYVSSNIDNKFILALVNYYLKNSQIQFANDWMELYMMKFDDNNSFISISNLMKMFENALITKVHDVEYRNPDKKTNEDRLKELYKKCKVASKTWKSFVPRFLHLQGYYYFLKRKKRKSNKSLKKGLKEAALQNNILEQSWITLNKNSWKYNLRSTEIKHFHWKIANHYSPLHWSKIMYALPVL